MKKMNLLFIGNSHTYVNEVPAIVQDLFAEIGVSANCVMLTKGGKCLDFHAKEPQTRYNILHGNYDYIILQGKATDFEPESYLENGKNIYDTMIAKTAAKTVLYMVWANRDKKQEQPMLTHAVEELAEYTNAIIAPAGEAWQKALRCRPKPELYQEDGNHARPEGSYLAASTLFYAISGRTRSLPVKVGQEPHTRLGIDTKTAATIQKIACKTASEYRR